MLILTHSDVERLLPMPSCITLMAEALAARARGETIQPLRTVMRLPQEAGFLAAMPAWTASPAAMGVKVISVFPRNRASGRDSHQGAVFSFDPATGELLAVLDAGAVTAIRTAAVSGVATDRLARPDADDLAILGAGVQAESHLAAMCAVRRIRRVRVWNRTRERAERLVRVASERHGLAIQIVNAPQDAVSGATIVCTVTGSWEPVVRGAWLSPGAHVNAVGSSTRDARELDTEAVARARLFVDARESALNEAGDLLIPMSEGRLTAAHIQAELGEVLIGRDPGRASTEEITLFKSLGLGIEDVVAAHHVMAEARRLGAGREVDLSR
jgi:ornithine cyclodeaminase